MRNLSLCFLLLSPVSSFCLATAEGDRGEHAGTKSVIGSWQAFEEEEDVQLRTTFSFRKDETFSATLAVKAFGSNVTKKFEGRWKLKGKTLEVNVVKSDSEALKDKCLRFKFVVVENELPLFYGIDEKGKPGSVYRRIESK